MGKFRQQRRLADPNSNRSQKKRLARHIRINDPEALLCAGGEYQQRLHKRDGRCRDYLRDVDAEKILGRGNEKTLQQYHYQVPLELVIQEAQILYANHGQEGENWVQYVVSAHYNVSVTGHSKLRTSSVTTEYAMQWVGLHYPDAGKKVESTEGGVPLKTTVKLPSKFQLKDTAPKTITQTIVTIKK